MPFPLFRQLFFNCRVSSWLLLFFNSLDFFLTTLLPPASYTVLTDIIDRQVDHSPQRRSHLRKPLPGDQCCLLLSNSLNPPSSTLKPPIPANSYLQPNTSSSATPISSSNTLIPSKRRVLNTETSRVAGASRSTSAIGHACRPAVCLEIARFLKHPASTTILCLRLGHGMVLTVLGAARLL